ncbi:phasin family protein [Herbaspirillum rubrisubalbicans]|uniref:Phasin (PHA-granule associated protein) n=1 Tax=Herbaspirillum rubrisubalbicans TaxID=80842 RepID=A0AAD0XGS9_9BURK|nr:phasin family protein [Herbaspirillum rubrisubalbicans]ALU88734.1 phasin family protein [Herbaspirillum rubrisubalbicans M1]AYR23783.1 Phasin (PHA-granule associated protein) [Herbaspirillum rubrisubalbicans]
MTTYTEQFSAAAKANAEAQLALFSQLAAKTFEGVEKLVDLNLKAAKSSLEESQAAAQKLFAAKDPQEFFTLTSSHAQPTLEKSVAYGRHLSGIFSSTQAELTKAAEAQIAEVNRKVVAMIDEAAKNAPAGSEQAISILKSTIGNLSAGYEQFTKNAKQAAEVLEANVTNAVEQISQAGAKVSRAAKK